MLRVIRELFTKKPAETVPLAELEPWFDRKAASITGDFEAFLTQKEKDIHARTAAIREKFTELQKAELQNPHVPAHALNYMKGNRVAYIKRISDFLDSIPPLSPPKEFVQQFKENLKQLSKTTTKSYHIMEEFFSDIAGAIADEIRKLNRTVEEVDDEYTRRKIGIMDTIRQQIASLENGIHQRKTHEEQLVTSKEALSALEQKKQELENKLTDLQSSQQYTELQKLKQRKKETEQRISEERQRMSHSFSVIAPALKKFERVAFENVSLIKQYLTDPIATVKQDTELRVTLLLQKLRENVESRSIELKDAKRKRILSEIDIMDTPFFTTFLEISRQLEKEVQSTDKGINQHTIEERLLTVKQTMHDLSEKIMHTKGKVNEHTKLIQEIDITQMKNDLQTAISNTLRSEIIIA